nr:MAG TPA: hypothetical protein [Bacteriophage sp.]
MPGILIFARCATGRTIFASSKTRMKKTVPTT